MTKDEELDVMTTAMMLEAEENRFANEMEDYIKELKNRQSGGAECKREALEALKRTGVVTCKGRTRKKLFHGND